VAAAFAAVNTVGWRLGGLGFVQEWGGSFAAVIATAFLVWKTQGYWAWMIVNAALWVALFFHLGLPMLAWLQVSFLLFCGYGAVQWALVHYRIGFDPKVRSDVVGSVLAAGVFGYSIYAYWNMPGYRVALVGARARKRRRGDRRDLDGRLPLQAELGRLDGLELLLVAALLAYRALGPVLHRLRLPGDQRRRLHRVGARGAASARCRVPRAALAGGAGFGR
jgi:hypothetical protein